MIRKMTREEAIKKHREMWAWIAKTTRETKHKVYKSDFLGEMNTKIKDFPLNGCSLCEYASKKTGKTGIEKCVACPLDWGETGRCADFGNEGLYMKWYHNGDYLECAELAEKIANLKEREI